MGQGQGTGDGVKSRRWWWGEPINTLPCQSFPNISNSFNFFFYCFRTKKGWLRPRFLVIKETRYPSQDTFIPINVCSIALLGSKSCLIFEKQRLEWQVDYSPTFLKAGDTFPTPQHHPGSYPNLIIISFNGEHVFNKHYTKYISNQLLHHLLPYRTPWEELHSLQHISANRIPGGKITTIHLLAQN